MTVLGSKREASGGGRRRRVAAGSCDRACQSRGPRMTILPSADAISPSQALSEDDHLHIPACVAYGTPRLTWNPGKYKMKSRSSANQLDIRARRDVMNAPEVQICDPQCQREQIGPSRRRRKDKQWLIGRHAMVQNEISWGRGINSLRYRRTEHEP